MKYVGIDWASEAHQCALIDDAGTVLDEWEVAHHGPGLVGLVERLKKEGGPESVLVALEAGAPLVVDQLLQAEFTVYRINPKQADRFRDRFTAAGAKDDRRDALVLASAIRTDREHLQPLERDSELCEEIRLRDRARSRKVTERTRLGNQLREALARYYPAALQLQRSMHDAFFLAFLKMYPDPDKAARARGSRIERLLRSHRIRALDTNGVMTCMQATRPHVPAATLRACRDDVRDLVVQLELLNKLIDEADQALEELLKRHPDRESLMSTPGLGFHLAIRVIAELGDSRDRYPDASILRALAGTAPVTRRSGKLTSIRMRRGCNRRLQAALFNMARCSVRGSTWAASYYRFQRDRGVRHAVAVRALSNKWAKIIWALLERRTLYREELHQEKLRAKAVAWCPPLAAREEANEAA